MNRLCLALKQLVIRLCVISLKIQFVICLDEKRKILSKDTERECFLCPTSRFHICFFFKTIPHETIFPSDSCLPIIFHMNYRMKRSLWFFPSSSLFWAIRAKLSLLSSSSLTQRCVSSCNKAAVISDMCRLVARKPNINTAATTENVERNYEISVSCFSRIFRARTRSV